MPLFRISNVSRSPESAQGTADPNANVLRPPLKTAWIKARPFVWAIGGHAVVLALLFVDWTRHRGAEVGGAEAGRSLRIVEATLASSATEVPTAAPASAPPETTTATPTAEEPPPEKERIPADRQVRRPARAAPTPSVATAKPISSPDTQRSESAAGPAPGTGEPSPDADADPYAEMRRQRAEAERAYQLQQAAARGAPAQGAQASGAAPADGTKAVASPAGADFPPLSTSPHSGDTDLFASEAACDAARPGASPAASSAWIDCLFRTAAAQWLMVGPPHSAWSLAASPAPVLAVDDAP